MADNDNNDLDQLARLAGIEPQYWDIWGNLHRTGNQAKASILAALGISADSDAAVAAGIATLEETQWRQPLPPVAVFRIGQPVVLPLVSPARRADEPMDCRVLEESGHGHHFQLTPGGGRLLAEREVGGERCQRWEVTLPVALPPGYHDVFLAAGAGEAHTRLIVAPEQCYLPEPIAGGARQWGVSTHLYSLRRDGDWGIGDFTGLVGLVDVAASLGAAVVGLNPLHTLFTQHPDRASPYSPSSRLFLNPLYIDPEAVPDFAESRAAQRAARKAAKELAASAGQGVRRLPRRRRGQAADVPRPLRELPRPSPCQGRRGRRARPGLRRLRPRRRRAAAPLRAVRGLVGRLQRRELEGVAGGLPPLRRPGHRRVRRHSPGGPRVRPVSPVAGRRAARRRPGPRPRRWALPIGLYRDLAVGAAARRCRRVDRPGRDRATRRPSAARPIRSTCWARTGVPRRCIRMRCASRATPPFVDILRANMRHAGALRIDHVMGLMHLFWIPKGRKPDSGAYIEYPFEDLLAVLALESHRNRCLVVGEDLGTVPDGFRERMAAANVLSYRVLYFEKDGDRFKRPRRVSGAGAGLRHDPRSRHAVGLLERSRHRPQARTRPLSQCGRREAASARRAKAIASNSWRRWTAKGCCRRRCATKRAPVA